MLTAIHFDAAKLSHSLFKKYGPILPSFCPFHTLISITISWTRLGFLKTLGYFFSIIAAQIFGIFLVLFDSYLQTCWLSRTFRTVMLLKKPKFYWNWNWFFVWKCSKSLFSYFVFQSLVKATTDFCISNDQTESFARSSLFPLICSFRAAIWIKWLMEPL